jgi:methyltransferase
VSNRNAAWSFANGGKEYGQGHYPFMVVLHTGFLLACVGEVIFMNRTFDPLIGYSLIVLAVLAQMFRWWCITTLGQRWNTRVIIVPGLPRVSGGPYRWISHPNYLAVVAEGIILPLIHNAYITAIVFTLLNAVLLMVRISVENNALSDMELSVSKS